MPRAMPDSRWQQAQTAELTFWKGIDVPAALSIAAEKPAFLSQLGPSLLQDLFGKKEVLEIGCGPLGLSLASFTEAKYEIRRLVKTDPLPRMVLGDTRVGQHRWAAGFVRWLQELADEGEYVQSAGESLGMVDAFDTVIAYNVLDHVHDPHTVLRKAYVALRSGGHLIVGVDCLSVVGRLRFEHLTRRLHPDTILVQCHPHSFTPRHVTRMITDSGFRMVSVAGVPSGLGRWAGRHCRPAFLAMK